MKTYIAFFRGINVGGNNALPMKDLVALLDEAGANKIKTYIQSGNAVFNSSEKSPTQLAKKLAAEIMRRYGFEPYIHIIELAALKKAMSENPFPEAEADPSSLHLGFLSAKTNSPNFEKLTNLKKDNERFYLSEDVFYLHAPEGVGRSKLAASAEKLIGVPMTVRNWRTVCNVKALAED